jgi:hypothetical protein
MKNTNNNIENKKKNYWWTLQKQLSMSIIAALIVLTIMVVVGVNSCSTYTISSSPGQVYNCSGQISETPFIIVIVALVVFALSVAMKIAKRELELKSKQKNEWKLAFDSIPDFTSNDSYVSLSGDAISFDNTRKKLCFFNKDQKANIYDYSKILQCELVIDGETISKKSTGSAVGRAVLGGILTGGIGAIIGGVTGKSSQKQTIKNMDLKIIINDTTNPIFKINFYTGHTIKGSAAYKAKYAEIEKWNAIISGLISHGSEDSVVSSRNGSVQDELKKLKDLLDSGTITQVEFEKQKHKILA